MKIMKSFILVSIIALTLFLIFGCEKDATSSTNGDGEKSLIIASTRAGKYAIIDPETGTEISEPTPGALAIVKPCLGYQNDKAFFLSYEQGISGNSLFGCDAQTGANQYKLINQTNINIQDIDGSPVAKRLVLSGIPAGTNRSHIFTINEDGSSLTQITFEGDILTLSNSTTEVKLTSASGPAWSPGGTKIGFFAGVRESISNFAHNCVVVMNSDGSNKQILYSKKVEEAHYRDICWTHDCNFLLFSVSDNGRKEKAIHIASNTLSDITNAMDTGDAVEYFCTSPNSMEVVFNHRNNSHLKTVNLTASGNTLSASGSTPLISDHGYAYPDWAGTNENGCQVGTVTPGGTTDPNGDTDKSLIVASTRAGKYAIIDPVTGAELSEPTPGALAIVQPSLGYLSEKVFFLSYEQGISGNSLFGCDAQTGANQYKLISQSAINVQDVDGSPVAQKLIFSGILAGTDRSHIFTINEDGNSLLPITFEDDILTLPNTTTEVKLKSAVGPVWSPDGTQIGFFAGVRESISNFAHNCVVVMNSDGSNKQIFYSKPVEEAHYRDACWTHDSAYLLFSVSDDGRKEKAIHLASSTLSDITSAMDSGSAVEYFCTSPNSMNVVFNHRMNSYLKTVNIAANGNALSASGSTPLADTHGYAYPDWAGWDGN